MNLIDYLINFKAPAGSGDIAMALFFIALAVLCVYHYWEYRCEMRSDSDVESDLPF